MLETIVNLTMKTSEPVRYSTTVFFGANSDKISTNQMLVEITMTAPLTRIQTDKMLSNCIVKGCKSFANSGDVVLLKFQKALHMC